MTARLCSAIHSQIGEAQNEDSSKSIRSISAVVGRISALLTVPLGLCLLLIGAELAVSAFPTVQSIHRARRVQLCSDRPSRAYWDISSDWRDTMGANSSGVQRK